MTTKGKNVNYKTGRWLSTSGYYRIWSGYNKTEYEHKIIYQLFHMCCLLPKSVIHHINGIKTDNRIENLELTNRSDHMNIHRSDLA